MIEQGYIKLFIVLTTELNTDNAGKVVEQLEQADNTRTYNELVAFYEQQQRRKTAKLVHYQYMQHLQRQQARGAHM